jgi:hypothetical protein
MPQDFAGAAQPMSPQGLGDTGGRLGVRAAEIWAVLTVETRGCGFLTDKRPLILFERHIFHRETAGLYDEVAPDVSNPAPGGYGAAAAHQYDRLASALRLDRRAALRSTSWGIGQVMGFNAELAGYTDVETMVRAMGTSEDEQLRAMAEEIVGNHLDGPLQTHDWPSFARGYNGPTYAQNRYDIRLAAAYQRFAGGLLPDLTVRRAQVYLTYLGFDPGPIDGVLGRKTRSALAEFQAREALSPTGDPDEATTERLITRATG